MQKHNITPAAASAAARGDLENFLVAATPGGIERQEAMGQAALLGTRNQLPRQCPRKELEKLGFKFAEPENAPNSREDIFTEVIFPAGWSKRATDHSMWSDLLDDKGRKRGAIFYKAAFYDRSAHMSLEKRYVVTSEYLNAAGEKHDWNSNAEPAKRRVVVEDRSDKKNLHESEPFDRRDYAAEDAAEKVAKVWLAENFPQHEDVNAYW